VTLRAASKDDIDFEPIDADHFSVVNPAIQMDLGTIPWRADFIFNFGW
jgi:hypothetical protein